MKNCFSNEDGMYMKGLYSPAKRRFLQQPPENLSIGGRLRRERLLRKLTIDEMASFLGISTCYLGSIERGQRPVSKKLEKVLHARLGLSYDFLLEGMPVTSSMISQYVRETGSYSTRHNIDVLLNVCNEEELDDTYDLMHTYLSHKRATERRNKNKPNPDKKKPQS